MKGLSTFNVDAKLESDMGSELGLPALTHHYSTGPPNIIFSAIKGSRQKYYELNF